MKIHVTCHSIISRRRKSRAARITQSPSSVIEVDGLLHMAARLHGSLVFHLVGVDLEKLSVDCGPAAIGLTEKSGNALEITVSPHTQVAEWAVPLRWRRGEILNARECKRDTPSHVKVGASARRCLSMDSELCRKSGGVECR
jgi:hypothetical protein